MEVQTEQCDNCGKHLSSLKMATHFGYCRRNFRKCSDCGSMYDLNFPEEHQEEYHKIESCRHCSKQFSSTELLKHESVCSLKPRYCEHCQQHVPVNQYTEHLGQCESRTRVCEKCGRGVTNATYICHVIECDGPEQKVPQTTYNKNEVDKRQIPLSFNYKGIEQSEQKDIDNYKKELSYFQEQNNIPQMSYNYQYNDEIPSWVLQESMKQQPSPAFTGIQPEYEDEQLQKALMMSMGIEFQKLQ